MLEKGRMKIPSTEVTSILIRDDIEKSTWRIRSEFPRRIDVIISTWIRLSKSMRFPRIFHEEFRRRIDGKSTKMCTLG